MEGLLLGWLAGTVISWRFELFVRVSVMCGLRLGCVAALVFRLCAIPRQAREQEVSYQRLYLEAVDAADQAARRSKKLQESEKEQCVALRNLLAAFWKECTVSFQVRLVTAMPHQPGDGGHVDARPLGHPAQFCRSSQCVTAEQGARHRACRRSRRIGTEVAV